MRSCSLWLSVLALVGCAATAVQAENPESREAPGDDRQPSVLNPPDAVVLVRDGRRECVIVLPKEAGPSEAWAAEELQAHLREMTGAEVPILPDGKPNAILLGSAAKGLITPDELAALGDDGYIIRTQPRLVAIAGGPKRGTLYGVYTFLERLGVRWWTPTETHIPKLDSIAVEPMDLREVPRLQYRDIMYRDTHGEVGQLWMARNKLNGMIWKDAPAKLGGRYPFGGKMLAHTLMDLLKKHKVEITPEMMSMDAKGARAKPGSRRDQLCFTNRAAVEAITRVVVAEYKARPDIQFVMIGQEDGHNYCRCPECQAIAKREESQAGPVVHFANAVAEAAEKEVPGAAVAVNAYVWSRTPPKHLRPRPNVYVVLASYECDFGHPLADSVSKPNVDFRRDLERWDALTERLYVWDYVVNFLHYLMPQPNLDVMAPNLEYYADHGVVGVMEQGAWNAFGPEFAPLRQWGLAKALWNPEADNRKLIEEFCRGYYGPAGPAVLDYIDATHRFVREHPDWVQGIYRHTNSPHIAPAVIAEAEAALRKADAAAAESGDETFQRRVRHAHMPVWYVLLRMGPGSPMWRAVEAKVGRLDPSDVARDFSRVVSDYKMNELYEGGPGKAFFDWVADYGRQCAGGRVPAPEELKGDDWTRVRLIQGCQMDRGAAWYVRAEEASDGWAIRPARGKQVLHYLSDTNDFTPGTAYVARVRARAEGVADQAAGDVWTVGVGNACTLTVTAEQLRDGRWHTFEVGRVKPQGIGTAVWSQLLWKQRDALKHVDIDCVWLEKAE